jgi:hypothetical protein
MLIIADTGNEIQVARVMPFDPGRKLQQSVQDFLATPPASSEVCVLSGGLENHEMLNVDTICNIIPTMDNQISLCVFLISCHQYNTLLVDALGRIILAWEVEVTWLYKGSGIINVFGINFTMSWDPGEQPNNYEMLQFFSCLDSQMNHSKWIGQQLTDKDIMADSVPSSVHGGDSTDDSTPDKYIHIPILTGCITACISSWLFPCFYVAVCQESSVHSSSNYFIARATISGVLSSLDWHLLDFPCGSIVTKSLTIIYVVLN